MKLLPAMTQAQQRQNLNIFIPTSCSNLDTSEFHTNTKGQVLTRIPKVSFMALQKHPDCARMNSPIFQAILPLSAGSSASLKFLPTFSRYHSPDFFIRTRSWEKVARMLKYIHKLLTYISVFLIIFMR